MDRFQKACQAGGPLVFDVEADGAVERFEVDQPFARVGRSSRSDLPLRDAAVSKKHAYFQVIAGRVFCVDLGSRSGIHWDGKARKFGWVGRGQAVGIGPFQVRFREGDTPAAVAPKSEPDGAPPLPLDISDGETVTRWDVKRPLTLVGSRSPCALKLADPSVSKVHASLVRAGHGLWVVNLYGRGGVLINGRDVRCASFSPGDEIRLGKFTLRFGGPPGAEPPSPVYRVPAHLPASQTASPPNVQGRPAPALAPHDSGGFEWAGSPFLPAPPLEAVSGLTPDQVYQALMMMHSYNVMQREQMSMIMGELRRLGGVIREVQDLKRSIELSLPSAEGNGPPGGPFPKDADGGGRAAVPETRAAQGPDRVPPASGLAAGGGTWSTEQENILRSVHRRLSDLQQERQSGWQRLLGLLQGETK